MGKRIIITEAEKIEILKKYGLNEGIPEYLEAGAAAFFFYKFFQGFRKSPFYKRNVWSKEDKAHEKELILKGLPSMIEWFRKVYQKHPDYDHQEILDFYHNELLPMIEKEEVIDLDDVMDHLEPYIYYWEDKREEYLEKNPDDAKYFWYDQSPDDK